MSFILPSCYLPVSSVKILKLWPSNLKHSNEIKKALIKCILFTIKYFPHYCNFHRDWLKRRVNVLKSFNIVILRYKTATLVIPYLFFPGISLAYLISHCFVNHYRIFYFTNCPISFMENYSICSTNIVYFSFDLLGTVR